jgi:hypothetical protein
MLLLIDKVSVSFFKFQLLLMRYIMEDDKTLFFYKEEE